MKSTIQETGNFNDFSHLEYWDKYGSIIKQAKETVEKLRKQTKGYFDTIEELKKAEEKRYKFGNGFGRKKF